MKVPETFEVYLFSLLWSDTGLGSAGADILLYITPGQTAACVIIYLPVIKSVKTKLFELRYSWELRSHPDRGNYQGVEF